MEAATEMEVAMESVTEMELSTEAATENIHENLTVEVIF